MPLIQSIHRLPQELVPLSGGEVAADAGDQPAAAGQTLAAQHPGKASVHTHSHGKGGDIVVIMGIQLKEPLQLLGIGGAQMPAQTQQLTHEEFSLLRAPSTIGGSQTDNRLRKQHHQGQIPAASPDAQQQPQQRPGDAHQQRPMGAQMQRHERALQQPAYPETHRGQQHGKQHLPGGAFRQCRCQRQTADQAHKAGNAAKYQRISGIFLEVILHTGTGSGGLGRQTGIMVAGAVNGVTAAKKAAEAPVFKIAAFVAHVHPPVQQDPAVVVQLDQHIAKPRPGQDHHGKIRPLSREAAAHIAGAEAFRRGDTAHLLRRQAAHSCDPVEEGQQQAYPKDGVHHAHIPFQRNGLGEHFFRHRQVQRDRLPVQESIDVAAGDDIALDIPLDHACHIRLEIAAGEGRRCGGSAGKGDAEGHIFHRIGKACHQRDTQIRFFIGAGDRTGQGILNAEGEGAGAGDDPGKVDAGQTVHRLGADAGAVQRGAFGALGQQDHGCVRGVGEYHGDGHADPAGAVFRHGHGRLQVGSIAFGSHRHGQKGDAK